MLSESERARVDQESELLLQVGAETFEAAHERFTSLPQPQAAVGTGAGPGEDNGAAVTAEPGRPQQLPPPAFQTRARTPPRPRVDVAPTMVLPPRFRPQAAPPVRPPPAPAKASPPPVRFPGRTYVVDMDDDEDEAGADDGDDISYVGGAAPRDDSDRMSVRTAGAGEGDRATAAPPVDGAPATGLTSLISWLWSD